MVIYVEDISKSVVICELPPNFQVKPAPTISWLKDGKPIEDARFKLSREEDGTLKLKIDSVELDDKSRITIRAENQFGSAGM